MVYDLLELASKFPTVARLKKDCDALQTENNSLKNEIAILKAKIEQIQEQEAFLDLEILVLKKNIDGTISRIPRCPTCKKVLSDGPISLFCSKCDYHLKKHEATTAINKQLG